jgi:gluconate 2-dehydrogenase subunit 3-like protein
LSLALLGAGTALAVVRTRGYAVEPGRRLVAMSAWQLVVVQHAARRIVAPDRADDPSIPTPDVLDVAGFVDGWMARLPAPVKRDLGRMLAVIEHAAPLAAGFASRFTRLAPPEQDRVLASLEASPVDLLRAGFDGLKALVLMGYYRDARAWAIVGYDGPLVARPPEGWTAAARGDR